MKPEPEYHSYLVRLWREEPAGGEGEPPAWLGEMLHIQSGEKWLLHELREVLAVLKANIEENQSSDQYL